MGAKNIIGYPTKKRAFLLTSPVEEPQEDLHKVEYFLNIARSAGIKPDSVSYEFFVKDSDRIYADGLLRSNGIEFRMARSFLSGVGMKKLESLTR